MTLSAEQFRSHLVWTSLSDLGPIIDEAMTRDGLDASTLEELARLKLVLSFTGRRLAGADPYLFQPGYLDSISTALATAATHVRSFILNGNVAHIPAANVEADKVLTSLAQLNVQISTEDFVAAKEAAENYRLSFNKIFGEIKSETSEIHNDVESFKLQLSELATEKEKLKEQLLELSPSLQSEFEAAQKARLEEWEVERDARLKEFQASVLEYNTALSQERDHLALLVTENQKQFEATQEAQVDAMTKEQKERQENFDALVTKYSDALEVQEDEFTKFKDELEKRYEQYLYDMKKEFADSASAIRDEILGQKREVDVLVGIIGDRGVTSGHQKAADEARTTTRVWQGITIFSMISLIGLAIFTFLPQLAGTFTWEGFAGRVFISLTVGVLAAYAGSQADKYQKIERYSRNLALELQAIGPYIAPLSQEKQDEFRLKIGDRTFGREGGNAHKSDERSPTSVADVIAKSKDLSGFATDLIKTTADVVKNK